jgi:hypothetical protein
MTDSLDDCDIDRLSEPHCPIGRYDKLLAAGMATRFVKGTSGNPKGRPKRRQPGCSVRELADLHRDVPNRA